MPLIILSFIYAIYLSTAPFLPDGFNQHSQHASFVVISNSGIDTLSFNSDQNTMLASPYENDLWIRFAIDQENDGENSPHLDIDICNYNGAGTYHPADPQQRPCPEGNHWDLWWHGPEGIYINKENSTCCQLIIKEEKDFIIGIFSCSEMFGFKTEGEIAITAGKFRIKLKNSAD